MRVMWFCPEPCRYDRKLKNYRIGGGWTSSLINQLHIIHNDWEFAICCDGDGVWGKKNDFYQSYPVQRKKGIWVNIARKIFPCFDDKYLISRAKKAISEFKPDIIQIFGSEQWYGLIASQTSIPVILHFQGSMIAYLNAKYPPNTNLSDFISQCGINLICRFKNFYFDRVFRARAEREKSILRECRYYFGRTTWDKAIIKHYNPSANYIYCSEVLKETYVKDAGRWLPHADKKLRIISVLSTPSYKGHDLILKTARLLKEKGIDFSWEICGPVNIHFWEKKLDISCIDVNVKCCGGIYDEVKLKEKLLSSEIYVHPSYIDNSPNSICEAQILGLPVIACAVGGIPDLIKHSVDGLLIPANDPWMLAYRICELNSDNALKLKISRNASVSASKRHSIEDITKIIENTYKKLIEQ